MHIINEDKILLNFMSIIRLTSTHNRKPSKYQACLYLKRYTNSRTKNNSGSNKKLLVFQMFYELSYMKNTLTYVARIYPASVTKNQKVSNRIYEYINMSITVQRNGSHFDPFTYEQVISNGSNQET